MSFIYSPACPDVITAIYNDSTRKRKRPYRVLTLDGIRYEVIFFDHKRPGDCDEDDDYKSSDLESAVRYMENNFHVITEPGENRDFCIYVDHKDDQSQLCLLVSIRDGFRDYSMIALLTPEQERRIRALHEKYKEFLRSESRTK